MLNFTLGLHNLHTEGIFLIVFTTCGHRLCSKMSQRIMAISTLGTTNIADIFLMFNFRFLLFVRLYLEINIAPSRFDDVTNDMIPRRIYAKVGKPKKNTSNIKKCTFIKIMIINVLSDRNNLFFIFNELHRTIVSLMWLDWTMFYFNIKVDSP